MVVGPTSVVIASQRGCRAVCPSLPKQHLIAPRSGIPRLSSTLPHVTLLVFGPTHNNHCIQAVTRSLAARPSLQGPARSNCRKSFTLDIDPVSLDFVASASILDTATEICFEELCPEILTPASSRAASLDSIHSTESSPTSEHQEYIPRPSSSRHSSHQSSRSSRPSSRASSRLSPKSHAPPIRHPVPFHTPLYSSPLSRSQTPQDSSSTSGPVSPIPAGVSRPQTPQSVSGPAFLRGHSRPQTPAIYPADPAITELLDQEVAARTKDCQDIIRGAMAEDMIVQSTKIAPWNRLELTYSGTWLGGF